MVGRQIWEHSIFSIDADAETPPDYIVRAGDFRVREWTVGRDLRRALEAVVAA